MVSHDVTQCSSCAECAAVCPAAILRFDGTVANIVGDPCDCMGCFACVTVCPTGAVKVIEL